MVGAPYLLAGLMTAEVGDKLRGNTILLLAPGTGFRDGARTSDVLQKGCSKFISQAHFIHF